jgi:hypothetical protein
MPFHKLTVSDDKKSMTGVEVIGNLLPSLIASKYILSL